MRPAQALARLPPEASATDDQDYALRLVADLDPFDADIHGPLGRRELAKRQYAAALIEFQAALALGPPNLAEAHTDLGEVYLAMGPPRRRARASALSRDQISAHVRPRAGSAACGDGEELAMSKSRDLTSSHHGGHGGHGGFSGWLSLFPAISMMIVVAALVLAAPRPAQADIDRYALVGSKGVSRATRGCTVQHRAVGSTAWSRC